VFILAFIQELIPPIPSTVVTTAAGFLFLGGTEVTISGLQSLFWYVGLPIAAGLSVGALIVYEVVYAVGRPVVERWGSYAQVSWDDIERLRKYMRGHVWDEVLLFVARATPIIPSVVINAFCGVVRWNPVTFFVLTFLGTVVRAMWVGFLGWELGSLFLKYAAVSSQVEKLVIAIVLAGALMFLVRRRKMKTTIHE
jgi:membrane protein DedA with SNARE-associated domain